MAKKSAPPSDVYLRFIRLAEAIRGLPGLPALDPLEERILTAIAAIGPSGEHFSVRELMRQDELGSPATIHSRLTSMRRKGWIALGDTEDSRRKKIELTPEAIVHFERLSRALLTVARKP